MTPGEVWVWRVVYALCPLVVLFDVGIALRWW